MFISVGLLCTISQNSALDREPVQLYGPVGLRRFVRVTLELSRSLLGFNYVVHELVPPDEAVAIAEKLPEVHATCYRCQCLIVSFKAANYRFLFLIIELLP